MAFLLLLNRALKLTEVYSSLHLLIKKCSLHPRQHKFPVTIPPASHRHHVDVRVTSCRHPNVRFWDDRKFNHPVIVPCDRPMIIPRDVHGTAIEL